MNLEEITNIVYLKPVHFGIGHGGLDNDIHDRAEKVALRIFNGEHPKLMKLAKFWKSKLDPLIRFK